MLDKLLAAATANAKLAIAAAAGAALVAGGGAVAVTQVANSSSSNDSPSVTAPVTGADHASDQGKASRSDTATAAISLPKPSKSPDGAQGVHGACVSKVAQDRTKTGRDHGTAVSAAAKTCPTGGPTVTTQSTKGSDAEDSTSDTSQSDATETEAPKPATATQHGQSGSHKGGKH